MDQNQTNKKILVDEKLKKKGFSSWIPTTWKELICFSTYACCVGVKETCHQDYLLGTVDKRRLLMDDGC